MLVRKMKALGKTKYKVVGFNLNGPLYDFQNVMRLSLKSTLSKILKKVPECTDSFSYSRKLGFEKCFEFIVLSKNVGIQKPDPRIFALAIHIHERGTGLCLN